MDENLRNDLNTEYYKLFETVNGFDRNLLTVKGWGVTLSLVALTLGFQYQHYGIFLVASMSSIAFWVIEGAMKTHQMRFYIRMREIEFIKFEFSDCTLPDTTKVASPQIDWSWMKASDYFSGKITGVLPPPTRYEKHHGYSLAWFFPHVALPHIITFLVGSFLFVLGLLGRLKMPL